MTLQPEEGNVSKSKTKAEEPTVEPAVEPAPDESAEPDTADIEDADHREDDPADENPEASEFPSLEGEPGIEVAKRGADITERDTDRYRKRFVVQRNPIVPNEALVEGFDHEANKAAVVAELTNHGLRVLEGDTVRFLGVRDHEWDRESAYLDYSVAVTPAAVVTVPPGETVSPTDVLEHDEDHAERDSAGE